MKRTKVIVGSLALLVVVLRFVFPERPLDETGPRALLDAVFALALLVLMLLFAMGLGLKMLQKLSVEDLTSSEQALFSLPIGFGIIAYGTLAIGLIGILQPWAVLLWLIFIGIWSAKEWSEFASGLPTWFRAGYRNWREAGLGKKILSGLAALIFILTLCHTLSPPTDPDGLIDHLQAPRVFLEAGRLYPMPDYVFANYPFTIESLFTIGMIFGSDTFAKLTHLTFASILVLGTYLLGRRYLRKGTDWIAVAILIGMPIFPIWASLAYIDMGWALYELKRRQLGYKRLYIFPEPNSQFEKSDMIALQRQARLWNIWVYI